MDGEALAFEAVDPRGAEALDAVGRYFAELDARFHGGFDAGVDGASSDAEAFTEPGGVFLLARVGDAVAGCGGLARIDGDTAEIKRVWVGRSWRSRGIARRLLAELEAQAARRGHARVVLDTNGVLTEAIAMYHACGYTAIERYSDNPYAHHWFEKHLTPR